MTSIRISGKSEKFGNLTTSDEFLSWEIADIISENRMRRLLSEMARSAVVLDSVKYGGLNIGTKAHASFIENDDFLASREDSRHQVRFGQMVLNGADFREQPELVAVKPYDDRADLYREWAAHEYINSIFDRQVGFVNLGVYNDDDGTESIISQYDHDVISFDASFWAGDDDPASALRPAVMQRHAVLGMNGLGMFHGSRMTHGDAQAKNLAADRMGPRAIDLETARILDTDSIDDQTTFDQTRKDISSFIQSMGMVEANRQKVVEALNQEETKQRIVLAYEEGVRSGRAALRGEYVPDFGKYNHDSIRDDLNYLTK